MLRTILFIAICDAFLIAVPIDRAPTSATGLTGSSRTILSADEITNLATRLVSLERTIEERRKLENIPGVALVVVTGDKAVYANGFGLRDAERTLPVTPDTLFEIGSTTKAFTAMAAMMSVDDGKLALDDPPRKYLSYFKLRDPDADAAVTIRDLLSHRTGLKAYEDDVWLSNEKLSREAVIKAVMMNKPAVKFRETFQYNNVMYTAAGECVARAQQSTWEDVIQTRILNPLGMNHSAPLLKQLRDTSNLSIGYKAGPKAIHRRDFNNIAPAGGILSSAADMAQWLRLMIGGGVFDGKRLVSEKSFAEIVSKQIRLRDDADYGLGWGLVRWHNRGIITHTGGTDGFSSLVEFMPDQKIGFAFLSNVPESKLLKEIRGIIWRVLLDVQ